MKRYEELAQVAADKFDREGRSKGTHKLLLTEWNCYTRGYKEGYLRARSELSDVAAENLDSEENGHDVALRIYKESVRLGEEEV